LNANVARDKKHLEALEDDGWNVKVVWECQTENPSQLLNQLSEWLSET
jgi:G:T-mismatch repair DNA endonuclease (very short patch repair protein)